MNPRPFHPFGLDHWVAVLVVLGAIAAVVLPARKLSAAQARARGRWIGVALLAFYPLDCLVRVFYIGTPAVEMLPFYLCSALFFVGAYGHLMNSDRAHELVYLWTFSATLQVLITPTPEQAFPSIQYVRYFLNHGLLILNGFYVLFVLDVRVTFRSVLRAIAFLQIFEIGVGLFDWASGMNFMYLRAKPPSPTLLDVLGPWPSYLLGLEALAISLIVFWWGVAHLLDRGGLRRPLRRLA